MGEKNKGMLYVICPYCNYKGKEEDLIERDYIFEIANGDKVLECPKCLSESVVK